MDLFGVGAAAATVPNFELQNTLDDQNMQKN